MQAAARTPNSILRRRADKENDDTNFRAAKRNRLANRRVSFAPDDELETKHIFKGDDHRLSGDLAVGSPTVPLGMEALQPDLRVQQMQPAVLPPAMLQSPNDLSPLSMDLTNNSLEQQAHEGSTAAPAGAMTANLMDQLEQHENSRQGQLPSRYLRQHHMEYTRNITVNVPNLSALVEEDEEAYADGDTSAGGQVQAYESSHPSPSVMRVMQQGRVSESPRWNYRPGAEDTLDVKIGAAGLGETTFNDVYGSNATGDVTRAVRDGITGGGLFGRPGVTTRSQALGRKAVAAPETQSPACKAGFAPAAEPGPGAATATMALQGLHVSLPQPQPRAITSTCGAQPQAAPGGPLDAQGHQHPQRAAPALPGPGYLDNTTKLLIDDQTDAWRLPPPGGSAYDRRRLSVASNKVGAPMYRRDAPGPGVAGETTMLLGGDTGAPTVLLLADTATASAYERLLGRAAPQPPQPPSVAPVPRRGKHGGVLRDAMAVSSNAGDAVGRMSAQDTADMSLELIDRADSAQGNDLLAEGVGLSLDAFAMPPEPGISVAAGGKGAASAATARSSAPSISCQDFFQLVDVNFNEKVCRTSFLPQADPPPKTVAEVFEAAFVTGCHMEVRQANMIDVSGRLSSMQARVQELEAELTGRNPELFAEVQLANVAQVETVKEQVIMLKKLCRIRTVRSIKQTELEALEELLSKLEASKGKLRAEVAAMTGDAERLDQCVEEKAALTAAVGRRAQQDEEQLQEALQRRKRCEALHQRIQALRSQNLERERRLEEVRAQQRAAERDQVPMETLQRERVQLEGRLGALVARKKSAALTPGREGQLSRQVSRKREEIAALLRLHGLSIDLSRFELNRALSLVFRDTFDIAVTNCNPGTCRIAVSQQNDVAKSSGLGSSVVSRMGATAEALSCMVASSQLQSRLQATVQQLHRMLCLSEQLEAAYLEHDSLLPPEVVEQGAVGGAELQLSFINVTTSTKVVIRTSWLDAISSDAVAPDLLVEIHNLEPPEVRQQSCQALQQTVLSRLEPGLQYFRALCYTMSVTIGG